MEQNTNKGISFSWKLREGNIDDEQYIKILRNYSKYGYSTMTRFVAAAVKEYSENHENKTNTFIM